MINFREDYISRVLFRKFAKIKFFRHNFPLFSKKLYLLKTSIGTTVIFHQQCLLYYNRICPPLRHLLKQNISKYTTFFLICVWKELYSFYFLTKSQLFRRFYWSTVGSFSLQVLNFRKKPTSRETRQIRSSWKFTIPVLTKISPA